MPHGNLEVLVVEGRNLKDRDLFGKMDPFVTISCGADKKRTKTKVNGGKNVTFNEKLNL